MGQFPLPNGILLMTAGQWGKILVMAMGFVDHLGLGHVTFFGSRSTSTICMFLYALWLVKCLETSTSEKATCLDKKWINGSKLMIFQNYSLLGIPKTLNLETCIFGPDSIIRHFFQKNKTARPTLPYLTEPKSLWSLENWKCETENENWSRPTSYEFNLFLFPFFNNSVDIQNVIVFQK